MHGSGIASLIGIIRHARSRRLGYLKIAGILTFAIPLLLGALAAVSWERCFLWFFTAFFSGMITGCLIPERIR